MRAWRVLPISEARRVVDLGELRAHELRNESFAVLWESINEFISSWARVGSEGNLLVCVKGGGYRQSR